MKKLNRKNLGNKWGVIVVVLCCFVLFIAFLASFSANWYIRTYGQTGFDSILYTLFSDFEGVEDDIIKQYIVGAFAPALGGFLLLSLILFFPWKKNRQASDQSKSRMAKLPLGRGVAISCALVCSAGLLYYAADVSQLLDYLNYTSMDSTIFQDEYQDPKDTKILFPEKKRNLIYIFMESMENTYFSIDQGGLLENSSIPELYELADDHVNFSCSSDIGGLYAGPGGTWTIGAMVSHTAGIPLKAAIDAGGITCGKEDAFLPGVNSLTDILHENGYYQTLMVGSDSSYGNRKQYFMNHSIDQVYDLYSAREDGVVPQDYRVWWGMEDRHLYKYAEQELTEISKNNQPFAFFMLTVDTHHIGGYVCPDCGDSYTRQYENVQACASRQLLEFLQWLQGQDFYEDTTIVIVGDHPSMDQGYMNEIGAEDFERCVYNCFVNSAVEPVKTREREAFTLDMFPTTLAAMGCHIEGERLGLGTNLFSDTHTLAETMGTEAFRGELKKNSSYYTKEFLMMD